MKTMRRIIAVAVALLLTGPATATAGGWTQPDGSGYAKVWGTGLFGSAAFGLDGSSVETAPYRLVTLSAYGEYGVSDDFTLVGKITPIGSAVYDDDANTFVGPILGGFRQRFVDGPVQLALELRAGGSPGIGTRDLAAAVDYEFRPTVQTAQVEGELQVGIGLGFGWFSAGIGPRWNSAIDNELVGFAQVGFGPFAGFVFDLHSSVNEPLGELEVLNVTGAGNTRYLGVGLGVSWWATDSIGFHVGLDGAIYAQSNAYTSPLLVGVEFRTP